MLAFPSDADQPIAQTFYQAVVSSAAPGKSNRTVGLQASLPSEVPLYSLAQLRPSFKSDATVSTFHAIFLMIILIELC